MSVTQEIVSYVYNATGIQQYDIPFSYSAPGHVKAEWTDGLGLVHVLNATGYGTDYTVSPADAGSRKLTLLNLPYPNDGVIRVYRRTPAERLYDYDPNAPFPIRQYNQDMDRVVRTLQDYTDAAQGTTDVSNKLTEHSGQIAALNISTARLNHFMDWDPGEIYDEKVATFEDGVQYTSLYPVNFGNRPSLSPTWWKRAGGGEGTGGDNYIKNPLRNANIDGWAKGPGAANITSIAWDTAVNLYGGGALKIVIGAGAKTANDWIEGDLTEIMTAFLMNSWQIVLISWVDTGSSFADDNLIIELNDGTNILQVTGSIPVIAGVANGVSASVRPSNVIGTGYKLRIRVKTGTTTGGILRLAGIGIDQWNGIMAPAVGSGIPYTPIINGFGACTNVAFSYTRIERLAKVIGSFNCGLPDSTPASITLPELGTILFNDASLKVFGTWYRGWAGANANKMGALIGSNGGSGLGFSFSSYSGTSSPESGQSGGSIALNGERIMIEFTVPIAQWTSHFQAVSEATEWASNSDVSATASVTGSGFLAGFGNFGGFGNWPTGTTWVRRLKYRHPIQWGIDHLDFWVREIATGKTYNVSRNQLTQMRSASTANYDYGPYFVPVIGDMYAVDVYFPAGGAAVGLNFNAPGLPFSNWGAWEWWVEKSSGGRNAAVPPKIIAEYGNMEAAGGGTSPLQFNTKIRDTHSCVTIGSGWKFMSKFSQHYRTNLIFAPSINTNGLIYSDQGNNTGVFTVQKNMGGFPVGIRTNVSDLIWLDFGKSIYFNADNAINADLYGRIIIEGVGV